MQTKPVLDGARLALVASSLLLAAAPPTKKPDPPAAPRAARPAAARPAAAPSRSARTSAPGGRTQVKNGPGPAHAVTQTPNGAAVHKNASGKVVEVHTANGAVIRHAPSGVRTVALTRPDGKVIVAHGGNGYVQRPLVSHGQHFEQRTYVRHGVSYSRVYRPMHYGGRDYHFYARDHYYRPGFYGWAHTAYAHPYAYRWGYEATPWYGMYGGYYAPYPVYASPAFWLTDFMLAATLEAAYAAGHADGQATLGSLGLYQPLYFSASLGEPLSSAPNPVTLAAPMPEAAKQALAEEVTRQLEQAKAEQEQLATPPDPAAPPVAPVLFSDHGPRTFLVAGEVTAVAGDAQELSLADGDVLGLVETPDPANEYAKVKLLAGSKPGCGPDTVLQVKVDDLVEMTNQMQATVDQGLEKLQGKDQSQVEQGAKAAKGAKAKKAKDTWPAPPREMVGRVDADFAQDVTADPNAAADFNGAVQDADQAEQEAIRQAEEAERAQAEAPAPPTIKVGMTLEQVLGLLGNPAKINNLFLYKILLYPDLKVTLVADFVTGVDPR